VSKRFSMLAYSGGAVNLNLGSPMVFDLSGLKVSRSKLPILRGHDASKIVGYGDRFDNDGRRLVIEGTLSESTEAGREVAALAAEGFSWQASVGLEVLIVSDVAAGVKVKLNSQTFTGPLTIIHESILRESSFCPMGADGSTSATIAEAAGQRLAASAPPPLTPPPRPLTPAEYTGLAAAAEGKVREYGTGKVRTYSDPRQRSRE